MSEQNDYSRGILNDLAISLMNKIAHSSPQGLRLSSMLVDHFVMSFIITLFSPNRRLGDLIANTKVVPAEKEPVISMVTDLKKTRFNRMTLLTLLAGIVYLFLLSIITNWLLWPL